MTRQEFVDLATEHGFHPHRYFVSVWHGEGGSIAEVRDRDHADDCLAMFSTVRHGAQFRTLAQQFADNLNPA